MTTTQGRLNLGVGYEKNIQDFRNELQEIRFKEMHTMTITGDTKVSNLLGGLLSKLDREYGTEYQQTESIKKLQERLDKE